MAKPKRRKARRPKRSRSVAPVTARGELGKPPTDDSLAAISWMVRALATMASEVLDEKLPASKRRGELLKIADRMAKLQSPDRIFQAEEMLRGVQQQIAETKRGPQTQDATDLSQQPGTITARRGRPPRSAIR